LAFGFFKDAKLTDINDGQAKDYGLTTAPKAWSQDHYYKHIPLSNTQKMTFNISKDKFIKEIKEKSVVSIEAWKHKLLEDVTSLPNTIDFSLVITIEEDSKINSGKLYSEICNVNKVKLLIDTELDLDIDL
jgi:hypothetical protein